MEVFFVSLWVQLLALWVNTMESVPLALQGATQWIDGIIRHPTLAASLVWTRATMSTTQTWLLAAAKHAKLLLSRMKLPEAQQKLFSEAVASLSKHWHVLALTVLLGWALIWAARRLRALLLTGQKDARVLILGLDNSGKTTLLLMLRDNRVSIPNRTLAPNFVRLQLDDTRLHATDLGGHEAARAKHPWEAHYGRGVTGVVFVVDASDANAERLERARKELALVLGAEALLGGGGKAPGAADGSAQGQQACPVLVLGNKIDLGSALSEAELCDRLGLRAGDPRVRVCMCSVVHKMGYGEGLRWLMAQSR